VIEMVSGGRYIGSIYVSFDKEANVEFKTYDNQFTSNNRGKEIKNDICAIIKKNLENIPLSIRKEIRSLHERRVVTLSCFKTLEANPDRTDRALYIFQLYTKSVITLGSIDDENNKLIPQVELARKNAVDEMLVYLDNRYGEKTYPYIVWFEDPLKYTYLRETYKTGYPSKPKKDKIMFEHQHCIVGYEVSKRGTETIYRVWWLKTYDRDVDKNSIYKNHAPAEAVKPQSIKPGIDSEHYGGC
jgi:hypothetical protein